jgi:hypothetical protein
MAGDRLPRLERAGQRIAGSRDRSRRPAVAAARRLLPGSPDRPGRHSGDRSGLPDPTGHRETARTRPVLRLTRPGQAVAPDSGRPARRPVPRQAGRHDRLGRAARTGHADDHHWPPRLRAVPSRRRPRGQPHQHHDAQQLRRELRTRCRHRRQRHHPDPVRRGRRTAVPGADLHRRRDPALGCPTGATLRSDAPGRRHARADLGDLHRRVRRRRRHRGCRRLRPVLRAAPGDRGDPVHRRPVLHQ